MTHPKVVPLQPDRRRPSAPLSTLVNSVRQQARKRLLGLLVELLDCTDDALFEMADRSHSDADHHLYFDSMRQIRLHRADIKKLFAEELNAGFERAFQSTAAVPAEELLADDMGLVHNDDLEISVAISGIVSKITSQFSLPIMELTKRLDHLAKHAAVSERCNPLGPQMVSEAFARAIEGLEVDIKIRIILLKLFERIVMHNMGSIYEAANHSLIEAGVLKDLRRTLSKGRNPRARRSGSSTGPGNASRPGERQGASGAGSADAGASFGTIQTLLAGLRNAQSNPGPGAGSVLATPQLLDVLNEVQAESGRQELCVEELPTLLDLRHVLVSRAANVTGESMNHLGRADEDVVNFIGLLFDYILNDRNLAIPMKALIARLQIPIVKLAILDKSFFERSAHPARELLNELSSAGIGWSTAAELKRDSVYDRIESVVLRVLNGFSDNPDLFQELLDEVREFRSVDTARNLRMEKRVKEKESGKARTLLARQKVQTVINRKACGLRLPSELGRFVSEVWSRVLVYVSLREGVDTPAWEELILTLDDLLWSLQPLDELHQIQRRDDTQEDLLHRLAAGMDLLQLDDTARARWCGVIREQLDEVSGSDRSFLEDDELPRVAEEFLEMPEVVLAEPHEVTDSYHGKPPEPAFVEQINRLSEGVWVEMQKNDGSMLRCKLAAIVTPGDRYVFVNRRGMKVAEKTRMELARQLEDQKVVVLNDSQVFDRALQAVIGNLRQVQHSASPLEQPAKTAD